MNCYGMGKGWDRKIFPKDKPADTYFDAKLVIPTKNKGVHKNKRQIQGVCEPEAPSNKIIMKYRLCSYFTTQYKQESYKPVKLHFSGQPISQAPNGDFSGRQPEVGKAQFIYKLRAQPPQLGCVLIFLF